MTAFNAIESVNEVTEKRSSERFLFGSFVILHKLLKQFSQEQFGLENSRKINKPTLCNNLFLKDKIMLDL